MEILNQSLNSSNLLQYNQDIAIAVGLESGFTVVAIFMNLFTLRQILHPSHVNGSLNQTLFVIAMSLSHNALLCAFECAETVTAIVTNSNGTYVKIWPIAMFLYIANTFCSFTLSINRAVATFRPIEYERLFPKKSVKLRLCAIWPAALLVEIPFTIPGCGNMFNLQTYRRAFMTNTCGSIMVWFSMLFSIVELTTTALNLLTLVKIRRKTSSSSQRLPTHVFNKRRRQELIFILEALSFSVSAFTIAVFINFVSLLSEHRFWQFCTSNLIIPFCCMFTALFTWLLRRTGNKVHSSELKSSSRNRLAANAVARRIEVSGVSANRAKSVSLNKDNGVVLATVN